MAETESSPSRGWTPKFIESLRPRAQRYELADPSTPGLRLRVHPSNVKSFRWAVTSEGKQKWVVIGPWAFSETPGHVTLKQAKDRLDRLKEAHRAGATQLDAVITELTGRLQTSGLPGAAATTFKTAAEEFYTDDIMKNRKRPEAVRDVLDRDLLPALGDRPLKAVTTVECRDVIKSVVKRKAPVHAGKVLAILKQLFSYAQGSGLTDRDPAAPLKARHLGVENNASERWLTDEEIALFWKALDVDAPLIEVSRRDARTGKVQTYQQHIGGLTAGTRAALRLLLITGARTGELLLAKWEHVDLKAATWTIPVENQKLTKKQAKQAKPFVIPLPPLAVDLFKTLKKEAKKSPWVMASEDSEEGHYTDKALGRAMRRLLSGKPPLLTLPGGSASPHDLRRTMRTHLGKLRIAPHITERCLNHRLGRLIQIYDQGDYLEERREALDLWAAYVERLVDPSKSTIAILPAKRA
jgi:integrase